MTYNKMLEQQFTVVIWEQRGAGKSYYKFDGPVTIDIFVNDLYTLVDYLLPRFFNVRKGTFQRIQLCYFFHIWNLQRIEGRNQLFF